MKKFIIILLVISLVLSFTACGKTYSDTYQSSVDSLDIALRASEEMLTLVEEMVALSKDDSISSEERDSEMDAYTKRITEELPDTITTFMDAPEALKSSLSDEEADLLQTKIDETSDKISENVSKAQKIIDDAM